MIDVRHLPATLRNKPHIRALSMKVYPHTRNSMIVIGGSTPHKVFAFGSTLKCDCTAASFGTPCAHIRAVQYVNEQERLGRDISSMFTVDRSSAGGGGIPVPLPRKQKQLYAGLFAGWFSKEDGEYGPSIKLKVLVTHTPAGKSWESIDNITQATVFVDPRWRVKNGKGQPEPFFTFAQAVTGIDAATLLKMSNDQIKEMLNNSVGCGVLFTAFIGQSKKTGADFNGIDKDSFDAPDAAFAKLAQKMREKVKTSTDRDGYTFISEPKPVYVAEDAIGSGDVTDNLTEAEDLTNEIPF